MGQIHYIVTNTPNSYFPSVLGDKTKSTTTHDMGLIHPVVPSFRSTSQWCSKSSPKGHPLYLCANKAGTHYLICVHMYYHLINPMSIVLNHMSTVSCYMYTYTSNPMSTVSCLISDISIERISGHFWIPSYTNKLSQKSHCIDLWSKLKRVDNSPLEEMT